MTAGPFVDSALMREILPNIFDNVESNCSSSPDNPPPSVI